jgi:uncharacterized protein YdhG (YjbR/CyaY superfamily)
MSTPKTIDDYIRAEAAPIRKVLKQMRTLVRKHAPRATEKLAWGMPTLYLEGNLLHFAAFKNHMSLFPGPDAIRHFTPKLKRFTTSKGTIQMPYEEPIPTKLVTEIVKFCVRRNLAEARARKKKKAARKRK